MSHPFSASEIKIARARQHLAELEIEIAAFVSAQPVKFNTRLLNFENGVQRVEIQIDYQSPPENLSAIVGDVVHNLRSALDLAACDIVRLAGHNAEKVYFPFCERPENLDQMIRRRNFHFAGDAAVALLRELKPYASGNAALRAIHDLDVQDKHTALIPALMEIGSPVVSRWDDNGTPNLLIVGDPTIPSHLAVMFPDDCAPAGQQMIPTFHALVELTTRVVEAFAALPRRS